MAGLGRRAATTLLFIAGDLFALAAWTPSFGLLLSHLRSPHAWAASQGSDAAAAQLAGTALWCWGAWIALGLACALLAAAPGHLGAISATIAHRSLPRAVRRLVLGSLGVGLAIAPLLAPATAGAAPTTASTSSPRIGWPTDDAPSPPVDIPWPSNPPTTSPPTTSTPTTSTPTTSTPSSRPPTPTTPPPTPKPPAPKPPTPTAPTPKPSKPTTPTPTTPTPTTPTPTTPAHDRVTVHAGDSLWLIAAHRLGPTATPAQIAAAWPQWYRANAAAIGADPNLIHPGQLLVPPPAKGSTP